MADQITTVSKLRIFEKYSKLSDADMAEVERAICVHLGITPKG
jgi:mRNA-degrading endonuclease toxin of MazEF toxin-antitoxin module